MMMGNNIITFDLSFLWTGLKCFKFGPRAPKRKQEYHIECFTVSQETSAHLDYIRVDGVHY